MDTSGIRVRLKLHTTIEDGGETEENTGNQNGFLYQGEDKDVLIFDEKLDDGSNVKNMMTIQSDKVSMKRSGAVSMHQQFDSSKITENVYWHPFGTMHMETKTHSIEYQPLTAHSDGVLRLDYTVKLNGQDERKHTLRLAIKKEA